MAYNEVLFFTFSEAIAESLGRTPAKYRVSFQRKDFNVTPYEIAYSGASPVVVSLSDSSDSIFETLLYQKYTFQLAFQAETWDKRFFQITSDQDLRVQIDIDEGFGFYRPFRHGFVQGGIREPHGPAPYIVEVSATCGLSLLKTRPLVDKNGRRLQGVGGFVSCVEVIRSALALTGLDLPLVTVDNLYEQAQMAVGQTIDGKAIETTDPLHKATIRAELLVDDEGNTINAEDALRLVLDPRMHRLCQSQGKWWTVRIPEFAGGWNVWETTDPGAVKCREYQNADYSTTNNTHYAWNFNIDPYVNLENPADAKRNRTATGGFDFYSDPEVGVKITQNFGRSVSKLPNADFSNLDSTGLPVGWQRNNTHPNQSYVVGNGTEANPTRLVLKGSGDEKFNADTPMVFQDIDFFIPPLIPGEDKSLFGGPSLVRTLTGRFRLTNARAAKIVVVAFRIDGGAIVPYLLKSDGTWQKAPSRKQSVGILLYNTTPINGIQVTKPGWADINLKMEAMNAVVKMRIGLCVAETLDQPKPGIDPAVEYADIKLSIEQEGLNLTGTSIAYVLPGATPRDMLTINLGDVPDQAGSDVHVGAVLKQQSGYPPTVLWYPPNANTQTEEGLAQGKTLLQILGLQYARQLLVPAEAFEGDIYGLLKDGPLSVLRFQDLPLFIGGSTVTSRVPYLITRYEHDLRMCQYSSIGAQRLMLDEVDDLLPTKKAFWITPDGESEIDYTPDNIPVAPTLPKLVGLADQIKRIVMSTTGTRPVLSTGIDGYTQIENDGIRRPVLSVYNGEQVLGTVQPNLRKEIDFLFPASS